MSCFSCCRSCSSCWCCCCCCFPGIFRAFPPSDDEMPPLPAVSERRLSHLRAGPNPEGARSLAQKPASGEREGGRTSVGRWICEEELERVGVGGRVHVVSISRVLERSAMSSRWFGRCHMYISLITLKTTINSPTTIFVINLVLCKDIRNKRRMAHWENPFRGVLS